MRLILCTLVLASAGTASADAVEDQLGPREMAVGEAMRGGATGASAIGLNPAGLPLNRELVFEGGYSYRPSDSASVIGVSACDSTNLMPGCFFYGYSGSSPELEGMSGTRRTHLAGLTLSRQFLPRVLIGSTTKYYDFNSTMTGEKAASGFAFDLGAVVRMTQLVNLGVSAQNLWASNESDQFPRTFGGGLLARPIPTLALSFDMRWNLDGDSTARYGGGIEWFIRSKQNGYPLRAGAVHDNSLDATYLSGGLGMATMKFGIDLGARRQIKNGNETVLLASMRFFGPRLTSPTLDAEPGLQ
ncbi:MAG: hypothetical protein H0V17_19260 [Deltaproteobacteria bacterium]|nr:hypothetical protein [Deltaproteobacteria bacterium]